MTWGKNDLVKAHLEGFKSISQNVNIEVTVAEKFSEITQVG